MKDKYKNFNSIFDAAEYFMQFMLDLSKDPSLYICLEDKGIERATGKYHDSKFFMVFTVGRDTCDRYVVSQSYHYNDNFNIYGPTFFPEYAMELHLDSGNLFIDVVFHYFTNFHCGNPEYDGDRKYLRDDSGVAIGYASSNNINVMASFKKNCKDETEADKNQPQIRFIKSQGEVMQKLRPTYDLSKYWSAKIVIEEGVKEIPEYSFTECYLDEIILPKSLEKLGNNAFEWSLVKKVVSNSPNFPMVGDSIVHGDIICAVWGDTLPTDKAYTGFLDGACKHNNKLHDVELSMQEIAFDTFAFCENLERVHLIGNNIVLRPGAFYRCKNLKSINLEGVKLVHSEAFKGCESLEEVHFSTSLELIGQGAFLGCKNLKRVIFDKGSYSEDIRFNHDAFAGCESLEEVELPPLTALNCIFDGCINLKRVVLPDTLMYKCNSKDYKYMADEFLCPFASCTSLEEILVSKANLSCVSDMLGPKAIRKIKVY